MWDGEIEVTDIGNYFREKLCQDWKLTDNRTQDTASNLAPDTKILCEGIATSVNCIATYKDSLYISYVADFTEEAYYHEHTSIP